MNEIHYQAKKEGKLTFVGGKFFIAVFVVLMCISAVLYLFTRERFHEKTNEHDGKVNTTTQINTGNGNTLTNGSGNVLYNNK